MLQKLINDIDELENELKQLQVGYVVLYKTRRTDTVPSC